MKTMAFRNFSTISKFPYSLLLLLLLLIILLNCVHCQITTYKVAVFEHAVISASDQVDNREQAIQAMKRNIDIYNKTTTEARLKGVKLITFPEYGIYGIRMSRKRMSLFAETIPDPKNSHRIPCEDPEFKGKSTEIQRLLSCIARDNKMFLVINMAGRESCHRELGCPSDGQYLFNTNVVFSPKGEIVARYYKTHLYEESWFNPAKSAEVITFNTPFGKFATFICFDVMFKNPAVEAVEKYNIRNIVSSVAWVKTPPIFRSIQMHSAFARGEKINFLVANLHLQESTSYGSGIYTPKGVAAYYYQPDVPGSKLIVTDIHPVNVIEPTKTVETHPENPQEPQIKENTAVNVLNFNTLFKFQHLTNQSGSVKVCHKSFCCKASYTLKRPFQETYALGIYNGYFYTFNNKLYVQICTLLKCPSLKCGTEIYNAKTEFTNISLEGIGFSSKYVYPSVLEMKNSQYVLVPKVWSYSKRKGIQMQPGNIITLHSANLLGRVYSRDIIAGDTPIHKNKESKNTITEYIKYIFGTILAVIAGMF